MNKEEILKELTDNVTNILLENDITISEEDKLKIVYQAFGDLIMFSKKDPSADGNALYILESYLSYQATLMYRISHLVGIKYDIVLSRKLSERSKLYTGIEIHPLAKIGKNFVLDHGIGTVIGETVSIGDNCYFLQNIILGSKNISNNKNEVRHPQIGNNVEIGGYVRIYGNIKIGNNVKISPHAVIRSSIPDDTSVILGCDYQILKNKKSKKLLYKGYRNDDEYLTLFLNNMEENLMCYLDDNTVEYELYADRILIKKDKTKKYNSVTLKSQNNEELIITI